MVPRPSETRSRIEILFEIVEISCMLEISGILGVFDLKYCHNITKGGVQKKVVEFPTKGRVQKKKKLGEFSTKRLPPPPPLSGKEIKKRKMIYSP